MNKVAILFIFWLGCVSNTTGQNLVPNPSFEQMNACPATGVSVPYSPGYNNFPYLPGWISATQMNPDFKHACGAPPYCSMPHSLTNYQYPHTGNGYAGIAVNAAWQHVEYVECKLKQPLTAGKRYHLHFYCAAGGLPNNTYNVIGMDKIGAVITPAQIAVPTLNALFYTPTIASPSGVPITDTQNWTRVQGKFQALGGEEWLTMGRFDDGLPIVMSVIIPGTANNYFGYYLIDDISLRDLDDPDTVRVHAITKCTAGLPVVLSGQGGGDEYDWNTGAGTATLSPVTSGTYWVRTWKDTFYYVDTFHLTVVTPVTLQLPADTNVCGGGTITITPNATFAAYQWNTGATTASITVSQSGQYILTAVDACGIQKDTINVFISPRLKLPADTFTCNNTPLIVSANAGFTTYQWNTGSTAPAITIGQSGPYILSVSDLCGQQKDTINVTMVPPVPLPSVRDTILCQGLPSPLLHATGDSLRWYLPPSSQGSFTQPVINTSVTGTRTLKVTQTQGGCESDPKEIRIDIIGKPSVELGRDTTLCDSVALLVGPSIPQGTSALWNTGATFSPIVVRSAGIYQVTLTNICGSVSDLRNITYKDCDSTHPPGTGLLSGCLFIPTAFTPNGDSRNEWLRVISICPVQRYHLMILNRRGQTVFDSRSISDSWDGTYKGQPAAADTYFWYLEFQQAGAGNVVDKFKGDLMLIR